MGPDELVKKLKELGIRNISRKTLYNWEKAGLIPEATFRNSRTTEYSDEALSEGYATGKLKEEKRLTNKQIKNARELALSEDLALIYYYYLDDELKNIVSVNTTAWWWLENKNKLSNPDDSIEVINKVNEMQKKLEKARKIEIQKQMDELKK